MKIGPLCHLYLGNTENLDINGKEENLEKRATDCDVTSWASDKDKGRECARTSVIFAGTGVWVFQGTTVAKDIKPALALMGISCYIMAWA